MEEKIRLTEKQENEFIKRLCEGDILGLEYLTDIINNEIKPKHNDNGEDIYNILHFVIELNSMVVYGEMFEGVCANNYIQIHELYDIMRERLFNYFDNDFDSLWEKYCY